MLKAEQILALSLEELTALSTTKKVQYANVLLDRLEVLLNKISDTRKLVCADE